MKFTETHEWIKVTDVKGTLEGTVGISHHAQNELGDIVYVELPKIGKTVKKGEEVAVLESTKAAADVYSPVSGTITEVNATLIQDTSLINTSAEHEGWLYKITLSHPQDLDALISQEQYLK